MGGCPRRGLGRFLPASSSNTITAAIAVDSITVRFEFSGSIGTIDNINPTSFKVNGQGADAVVNAGANWVELEFLNGPTPGDTWTFVPPSGIDWVGDSDPPASSGTLQEP